MDIPVTQLPPGDPRLIDSIVGQLKSKGIFDRFRKECLADVDTKPAYLNLRQRVDGQVKKFLNTQTWKNDLNKNQLRDGVRKNIQESGILDSGIDAIINQVVNPKIKPLILPLVEDTVYTFLQIEKPKREIQEYDGQLHHPHHEQKPFYGQQQQLMPPPYPPYSLYQEIPPPYYGGPEPPKPVVYGVSPRREIESNNDESSVSAGSDISVDEKPALEEQKPSVPVAATSSTPAAVPAVPTEILPMETDVISSGEDDILARASPESATSVNQEDKKAIEKIEMTEDNAVDSFDTARGGETDAMTTAVENLSIKEDAPKKEIDSLDEPKDVSTENAIPAPAPSCLPLFDSRSLDSISSNTSGLSFSPPSGTKSPTSLPNAPVGPQPPVADTSSTCKSMEDLRSTQSTPLVDEKSPPVRLAESASSSEENSKPWVPYTLPKDLPAVQRITIASFAPSTFAGASTTGESARVIEGASPVSADDSQGSLENTSSSIVEEVTTEPPRPEGDIAKDVKPPRSDKSEGEISTTNTTSSSSSNAVTSSSSSPEDSSRGSSRPRNLEKERHKGDSHHHSSKTSHREKSRDSGRDRHHHHSHKSKDDRERRHSKDSDHRRSSSKHDDHASHRDKDRHHSRRDKDDDKDRDRHGKGHSHSSAGATSSNLSGGRTSSVTDGGSKERKERSSEKSSSDHKSHSSSLSKSSSHSKSHSSSHSKMHSSSSSSHSKSHSSHSKSSSRTPDRKSSHVKSDSKKDSKSSDKRESKEEKAKDSISTSLDPKKEAKVVSKNSTSLPSTDVKKPKLDIKKKVDSKPVPKASADGETKATKEKSMKASVLKEDLTFGLHLSNEKKDVVLPKPISSSHKLTENRNSSAKAEEGRANHLKGKPILQKDEKETSNEPQTKPDNDGKGQSAPQTAKPGVPNGDDKSSTKNNSEVSPKANSKSVKRKSKENASPIKKLVKSPDTARITTKRQTRTLGSKRRTNGVLVSTSEDCSSSSSSSSSSSEDEEEEVSLPVLRKVTIPVFNFSIPIEKLNDCKDAAPVKSSEQDPGHTTVTKVETAKRKRGKDAKVKSRSFLSDSDSGSDSSSSLSEGDVLKSLFEDDSSNEDLSDFEGFTPIPLKTKTKKKSPPLNKVKNSLQTPVQTKTPRAKAVKKIAPKRLQQELVVVCDTGSDSSDMEMSVIKFCQNSSKSTPAVRQPVKKKRAPLTKSKSNDFEGFTDEGFEDSITSGSGADQRLREYLSRFTSVSGSPMQLDDFISVDSDLDESYTEETDTACTVFSSRNNTSIISTSGRSVIEEIAAAAQSQKEEVSPQVIVPEEACPLTASSDHTEEDKKDTENLCISDPKPVTVDLSQSPDSVDTGNEESSLEMVPPPLSLYEIESRMPLKKRKLSGSFSPAPSPAKVRRKMVRSLGDDADRTPLVEDFISKDIVMNTYSILTPEEDRTSSKDYEVDLSRRENSYSPLSPASDSSAEDIKSKLKINCAVTKPDNGEESTACPADS